MENTEVKDPILIEINKLDKNVKWILWIGAPILILMPILTTQFDYFFDFTNTGNIGDTIGGVTAPVIGVVSALLIYFSFRAQIAANRIIQVQIDQQRKDELAKREFNFQMEICNHVKEIISNYEQVDKKHFNGSDLKGPMALNAILTTLINKKEKDYVDDNLLKPIKSILYQIELVVRSFKNKEFDNLDIRLPLELICFTFEAHIASGIRDDIKEALNRETLVPENVYELYKFIDKLDTELDHLYMAEDLRQQGFPVYRD